MNATLEISTSRCLDVQNKVAVDELTAIMPAIN